MKRFRIAFGVVAAGAAVSLVFMFTSFEISRELDIDLRLFLILPLLFLIVSVYWLVFLLLGAHTIVMMAQSLYSSFASAFTAGVLVMILLGRIEVFAFLLSVALAAALGPIVIHTLGMLQGGLGECHCGSGVAKGMNFCYNCGTDVAER